MLHIYTIVSFLNQNGLKNMSIDEVLHDFDAVAALLGVDRATLPSKGVHRAIEAPIRALPQVNFTPVSDADWAILHPLLPQLPVAKPDADYRDRDFIDATLWWISAREKGLGWGKLPQQYWPVSSREHRHRRWCLLGYWRDLYETMKDREDLSQNLRQAFRRIAQDANVRVRRAIEARERLTGVR